LLRRTTAEEYSKGNCSYQFSGIGGLSWAAPYLVGVLALGWQIRSDLSADEMVRLIHASAYKPSCGARIIQPRAFIDSVKAL
jgi:serine protease AprX